MHLHGHSLMHSVLLGLAVLAAPLLLLLVLLLLVPGYAYLHVTRHAAAATSSNLRAATGHIKHQTDKAERLWIVG
jgi:Flp pilus assembly protein TadG